MCAAIRGVMVGNVIYILSWVPFFFFGADPKNYATMSAGAKFGASLLPNLAVSIGCKAIVLFESTGVLT